MICDNPKCQYYKPLPSTLPADCPYVEVIDNPSAMFDYQVKRVSRHVYVNFGGWGFNQKYLCGACHNAVQMVKEG